MNSIQAIQDRFGNSKFDKGKIEIIIRRSSDSLNMSISDNGIGLTDENFLSFLTPDTDHKLKRGGKGVGRLTWLKTFNATKVDSVFQFENKLHTRSFNFQINQNGAISNHIFGLGGTGKDTGTTVNLQDMRQGYFQTFPAKGETVANHIIRHFLPVFISGKCPEIIFSDNDQEIDIASELKKNIKEKQKGKIIFTTTEDKEVSLDIVHMKITSRYAPKSSPTDMTKPGNARNAVYFAADQRVGFDYILDNQLGMKTFDGCKYIGILEGKFINKHINQERTHLDLPNEDVAKLKERILGSVISFLSKYMEEVKDNQKEVYERLKADFPSITSSTPKNYIEKLPYKFITPEDILSDLAIHKIRAHRKTKKETISLVTKIEEVAAEKSKISIDQEKEIVELVDNLRPKLTKETNATLAEYMVRRRAVIDLLDNYMGLAENGKHFKEDLIHTLICPMHRVDNKNKLIDHNLWLLDDRFAFYSFLASDTALNQFTPSSNLGRPDVLFVLDEKLAFGRDKEKESPVFIVEFKRPSKSGYTTSSKNEWDTEDPFDRFIDYKKSLQKGISGDKTYDGRQIKITESRPVHCFLIADMTKNLEKKCESRLEKIEGANSYFGYVKKLGLVHAITYEDLISNARLRHETFFKMLGINNA
ncbi:MAG: ATP-binding protein [Rhodospirillaceae bacterium]|jgi:hypothetical protein|nr:ATP-binding protein [Rhodospirillaceae bacterium]MBT7356697.1 ATP-binding protein [Rhodospirillaceae bacterium]